MRLNAIAIGLFALAGAIAWAALAPRRIVVEANDAAQAVVVAKPNMVEKAPGVAVTVVVPAETGVKTNPVTNSQPQPGTRPGEAVPDKVALETRCSADWKLADRNGDGLLDADELSRYNSLIRSDARPELPADDRLTRNMFLASCGATASHE